MKALLTTNYICVDLSYSRSNQEQKNKFKQWVKDNQGKEVEIDTSCLFHNQYNTISGYRIYDTWIDSIKNDVRIGKKKCKYCGEITNGENCTKYKECNLELFSDKNTFFIAHPNGKDKIKKLSFKDHLKNERFYSCSSINGNYYRISRRYNIDFVLVGNLIYITNNIGYTPLNKTGLTANEKKIVLYCANRILTNNY